MPLIFKIFSINIRGREGETALHMAASCGCHELVLLLLKQGALVDPEVSQSSVMGPKPEKGGSSSSDLVKYLKKNYKLICPFK